MCALGTIAGTAWVRVKVPSSPKGTSYAGQPKAGVTLDLAYTPGAYVALTYKAYTVLGANVLGDANMPCIQTGIESLDANDSYYTWTD